MFKSSVTPEEIENLGLAAFGGEIHLIDEPGEELDYAVRYLARQKVIGFDTESRPCFSPNEHNNGVALLQLSGEKEAFLFRIKLLGMDERLCCILADPEIIKVGAAVNDDVRGLMKYRNFKAAGFVDLQKVVWEYGIKDKSVKKMSAIILGVRISKTQQLSNWETDYLSDAQLLYAATDAWICREMYYRLLSSEKNPLTPEEMNAGAAQKHIEEAGTAGYQPKPKTARQATGKKAGAGKSSAFGKKSGGKNRAKGKSVRAGEGNAPIGKSVRSDAGNASKDKNSGTGTRRRHYFRRRKSRNGKKENGIAAPNADNGKPFES